MNNDHDRERLFNDYVDETLPEEERRNVEAVVSRDPHAAKELAGLQQIAAAARKIPLSIEPDRDLWPGIASRLETMPRRLPVHRRPWRIALVAAALVGAFIGGILVAHTWPGDRPEVATGYAGASPGGVVFAEFQAARTEYADARQTLLAALEVNKASLSPQTRTVIEDNLAVINEAVADIETALAHDPSNRQLMELLVAAYDDEVGLLRQAVALPKEI